MSDLPFDEPAEDPLERAMRAAYRRRIPFANERRSALARGKRFYRCGSDSFEILGEIGRGGQGVVLSVWDGDLGRTLAMKVLRGEFDELLGDSPRARDPRSRGRFLEEAQVTGRLDHPGIVPIHELGLHPEGPVYFTMKLVEGEDLGSVFEKVRAGIDGWTTARALTVILRVCEAVAYAHSKHVIHRDLKPSNILVGKFGEVYVMDWGLARVLGQADKRDIRIAPPSTTVTETGRYSPLITMDGDVVGTPAYMPPEQALGRLEEIGPHSDVYAAGAMLYHLLAGHTPYGLRGPQLSNVDIWKRVRAGAPQRLQAEASDAPPELVAICEKAMARDWKQRYRDMSEIAADLSSYLEHRVVGAYETGTWAETKKWVQRNKPLAVSLAAAVILLAAGLTTSLVFKARADERANDLQAANTTIEQRSSELAQRNTELAKATKTAQANEKRAIEQEQIATQKASDVLSLSAIQELKELEDEADKLWPANPENVPMYDSWLAKAQLLIEGRAKEEGPGKPVHPSLADHEAKLAEIRKRAKPWMPEQVEQDRKQSPSYAEWEKERGHLQWMRRMLGEEPWPSESAVEAELAKESWPSDAVGLNNIAWSLVDRESANVQYGDEVKGLLLARRAVAAASESDRPICLDTLAWANFCTAHLDEALAEERRATDEIEGGKRKEFDGFLARLEHAILEWSERGGRALRVDEAARLTALVVELERRVNERRTYEFDDPQDRWWHAQLAQLVADLKALTAENTGGLYSSGISEKHGWGIPKRVEFARTIEARSLTDPEAKQRWDQAIAAIASNPNYSGLKMTPQLGLLPIGEDPDSHLWEFAHLQTGEVAQRDADGRLVLNGKTGLVFVLVPGGAFWMGAQKTDPTKPNFDPQAQDDESPVHELTLTPYFLSKYEMTQGQWLGFVGKNPSCFGPSTTGALHHHDLRHPVERVSWEDCMQVLSRLGLTLPSEAQWEHGARGGTDTPWWTGSERESLRGKANLADQTAAKTGADWEDIKDWPDLNDDWALHAPAGTFAANPFGLHEVHGNVAEWCLDWYDWRFYASSPKVDPVAPWQGSPERVFRGGSFDRAASIARSAFRDRSPPEFRASSLGLRPAAASPLSTSPHPH